MPDSAMTFAPTPGVRTFARQIEHFVATSTEIAAVVLRGLRSPPSLGDSAVYHHEKAALRSYATKSYDHLLESLRHTRAADETVYLVQSARRAGVALVRPVDGIPA